MGYPMSVPISNNHSYNENIRTYLIHGQKYKLKRFNFNTDFNTNINNHIRCWDVCVSINEGLAKLFYLMLKRVINRV